MTSKLSVEAKSGLVAVLTGLVINIVGEVIPLTEHWFVTALERVRRICFRLNPRLYFEGLRIRSVTKGLAPKASNKFAVFVVYSRSTLPDFTMSFISALNRKSYNLIIISNDQVDAVTRSNLLRNCCLLVERVNFGRDFGGYKDGISITFQRFKKVDKLIIANDSTYYLEGGLDKLANDLDGPEDFIGISEVFEDHYHVASFLLSFGPSVLGDPVFRNFWARYLPISTRMWVIFQGEGELTKCLMDAGHRPHILFQAEQLRLKLQALGAGELSQVMALLPPKICEKLRAIIDQPATFKKLIVNEFAEAVFKEVMERNQMHAAGFLFMKFLSMPLFKRDIVYRELFSLQEVGQIVKDLGEPMQAEIIADLARRPSATQYHALRRLLHRQHAI